MGELKLWVSSVCTTLDDTGMQLGSLFTTHPRTEVTAHCSYLGEKLVSMRCAIVAKIPMEVDTIDL